MGPYDAAGVLIQVQIIPNKHFEDKLVESKKKDCVARENKNK